MKPVLLLFLVIFCVAAQNANNRGVFPNSRPNSEVEPEDSTKTIDGKPCKCVPYYLCDDRLTVHPEVFVDLRESSCEQDSHVCCLKVSNSGESLLQERTRKAEPCGRRNPKGFGVTTNSKHGEAEFGEFPWMTAVLFEKTVSDPRNILVYHCGGALIHPQIVLTAAHCVENTTEQYKVRVGEWNTSATDEPFAHQERYVKNVIIHPEYRPYINFNDIALLILETPVEIVENVDVICLPRQNMLIDESRCFASGWGKDAFGKVGKYQTVLKKIELPIVRRNICQDIFRRTRLGKHFQLDGSFICAGGESREDTCTGDGGSPLICPIPGLIDRFFQAGIVSWGLGCGDEGIPAAYTNVPLYSRWIDEQLIKYNFDSFYYKY